MDRNWFGVNVGNKMAKVVRDLVCQYGDTEKEEVELNKTLLISIKNLLEMRGGLTGKKELRAGSLPKFRAQS